MRGSIRIVIIVGFLCSICSVNHAQESAFERGREIMEEVDRRNQTNDEQVTIRMNLTDKRGKERLRHLRIYSKRDEKGNLKSLVRFTDPKDVKGTGLLTVEHADREDDQWLYLPILRKNKRIAGGARTNYFVGTDFTFEDMREEKLSAYNYELLRTEIIDGYECYVIEATPRTESDRKNSGYMRRELWIRKDVYFPIQIKYYDREGKFIKMETSYEIIEIKNNIWRPNRSLMKNHARQHETMVTTEKREINTGIPDRRFTLRELESGK